MEKRRTKEWYCWVIVAACLLLSAASIGMLSYFNALFVTPVCESLHIARSSLSLMSTFSTVTTMLLLPFVGKLYDHIPMKLLVLLGAIAGGCAHLCYSLAQNTILFYLGGILSGIGACLAGAAPITLLLANWFEEKRGLATGIAFTGSSLVSSLLSPVVSSLIGTYGWRVGYRCIAAGLVLTILAALLLIRPTPAAMGLLPYGRQAARKIALSSSGRPKPKGHPSSAVLLAARSRHFSIRSDDRRNAAAACLLLAHGKHFAGDRCTDVFHRASGRSRRENAGWLHL